MHYMMTYRIAGACNASQGKGMGGSRQGDAQGKLKRKGVTYAELVGKLAGIGVMDSSQISGTRSAGKIYSGVSNPMLGSHWC
jgi:hypothetical protein